MEKGAIEKGIEQLNEVEQSTDLSLELVKKQYFDIDTISPNVYVVVPTKAQFKCMMRCKGGKFDRGRCFTHQGYSELNTY